MTFDYMNSHSKKIRLACSPDPAIGSCEVLNLGRRTVGVGVQFFDFVHYELKGLQGNHSYNFIYVRVYVQILSVAMV